MQSLHISLKLSSSSFSLLFLFFVVCCIPLSAGCPFLHCVAITLVPILKKLSTTTLTWLLQIYCKHKLLNRRSQQQLCYCTLQCLNKIISASNKPCIILSAANLLNSTSTLHHYITTSACLLIKINNSRRFWAGISVCIAAHLRLFRNVRCCRTFTWKGDGKTCSQISPLLKYPQMSGIREYFNIRSKPNDYQV